MFWELTSNRISRRLLRPSCQSQARGAWLFQGQPQALGLARTPPRGTGARCVQTPGGGRGGGFSSARVRLRLRRGRWRFPGDDPLCEALERRHSAANPEGRNWGRVGPQRAWLGGGPPERCLNSHLAPTAGIRAQHTAGAYLVQVAENPRGSRAALCLAGGSF